jgi:hypothetical protein
MLEERAAKFIVVIVELEPQARADIAGAPSMNDARDGCASIEPATERRAKRDEHLLTGEHASVGLDEHAFGREIEPDACDAAEIMLANDLAGDEHSTAEGFALHFAIENDAHRYLRFQNKGYRARIREVNKAKVGDSLTLRFRNETQQEHP